jgi:hypothetical protein
MSNSRKSEPNKKRCYPSFFAFSDGFMKIANATALPLAAISVAADNPAPFMVGIGVGGTAGGIVHMLDAYEQCKKETASTNTPKR